MGAASRELEDGLPPRTATTLSRETNFFAMVADSPAFDWLSSVISSTFRPRTPPAAFASSNARIAPLREDTPNAASLPENAPYCPILIGSAPDWAKAVRTRAAQAGSNWRGRKIMVRRWRRIAAGHP